MDIFDFLTMLGCLSLFLFGMSLMGSALERRAGSRLRSLLDQIAAQETVLKEKKDAEEKAKAERASERGNRRGGNSDRRGGRRNDRNASDNNSERNASESRPHRHRTNASNNVAAGMDFPNPDKQGKGKKRKGGHNNEEDHYSRMAREAEEYSREKVLEEARAATTRRCWRGRGPPSRRPLASPPVVARSARRSVSARLPRLRRSAR